MDVTVYEKCDVAQTCVAPAGKCWLRSVKKPQYLKYMRYQGLKSACWCAPQGELTALSEEITAVYHGFVLQLENKYLIFTI